MRKLKWLYSIVFSTAMMLAVAWTGAFFVSTGSSWYTGLFKPDFMPSAASFSYCTGITYCILIFLISNLVSNNVFFPHLPLIGVLCLLTAFWPMLFFGLHSSVAALVDLAIIIVIDFALFVQLAKSRLRLAVVFLPAFIWYCFLFILNYAIVMLN